MNQNEKLINEAVSQIYLTKPNEVEFIEKKELIINKIKAYEENNENKIAFYQKSNIDVIDYDGGYIGLGYDYETKKYCIFCDIINPSFNYEVEKFFYN
jgi:hypothetical protein